MDTSAKKIVKFVTILIHIRSKSVLQASDVIGSCFDVGQAITVNEEHYMINNFFLSEVDDLDWI